MNEHGMIKRLVLGFALVLIGAACAESATSPTPMPTATAVPYPSPEQIGAEGMITYYQMMMADETILEYGVVLPPDYDATRESPVLLALPPGPQTKAMVVAGVDGYWGREGQNRGWVVISPIAPEGVLFFNGSERLLPEFLDRIAALYPPEGGKFHLAGISNGGISAFRIAVAQPERFHSLTAVPGFPQTADFDKLEQLTAIPIALFVGESDASWVERMEATAAELDRLGGQVSLEIVPNEGHVIQSLNGGKRLYDILEANRPS
jgi:hypothetical protein